MSHSASKAKKSSFSQNVWQRAYVEGGICVCPHTKMRILPIYGEKRKILKNDTPLGRGICLRFSKTHGDIDGQNRPIENENLVIPLWDVFFPLGISLLCKKIGDAKFASVGEYGVVFSCCDATG